MQNPSFCGHFFKKDGDNLARARNIKPGFFKNEDLAELNPLGRILFSGLWCLADREGRLEDRPKRIKAEVLPYDECDVNNLLNQLVDAKFIIRYAVDDQEYIQIINFKKHQNPHMREAPSVIPLPNQGKHSESTVLDSDKNGTSPADSPISDSPISDSLNHGITSENPMVTIQKALQKAGIIMPSPYEIESLLTWLKEGMELALILLAIQKAALAGQRKASYINGILKAMSQQGITTLVQAEAAEAEFEQSKNKSGQARGPTNNKTDEKKKDKFKFLYLS